MAQLSLFLVVLLALVIPIFMARFKISTVPTAIAEIIVGIIVGSSGRAALTLWFRHMIWRFYRTSA